MLTDEDIERLIRLPKIIVNQTPSAGYSEADNHRRRNMDLLADSDPSQRFTVFIRQNMTFIENYSIGLRYHSGIPVLGAITILRYNGPHGETSRAPDGHFAQPHIHRITANELSSGSSHPQERDRDPTDKYSTFEQALAAFIQDTAIRENEDFLDLLQSRMFDGT